MINYLAKYTFASDYVLDYDDYVPDITIENGDNYYFCIQPFNSQVKEGKLSKDLYEIYAALIEFIYAFDSGQYGVAIANIKEDCESPLN